MKAIKTILLTTVTALLFFVGINGVSAKTYEVYQRGNTITVHVNDNETKEFYVLGQSESSENTVTALAKDVEGEQVDSYSEKITELHDSWKNVKTVMVPTLQTLFGQDVETTSEHTITEDWIKSDKEFFTSSKSGEVDSEDGKNHWIVGNERTKAQEAEQKYYVRPVIIVEKEYIDGGVKDEEASTEWTKFVDLFKNHSTVKYYQELENASVDITNDASSLTVKLTLSGKQYTTKFNLYNGIVVYAAPDGAENDALLTDEIWNEVAMQVVCEKFGYDYADVLAYFDTLESFSLSVDGIVMAKDKVTVAEKDAEYFKVLRMDIVNGFVSYVDCWNNQEKPPVNPSTGLFFNTGLFAVAVIGAAGAYMFIKKKNLFPQA